MRAFAKDETVPPCVNEPARSGDFLADAKIAWRDAYELQIRAAVRPLQQAAEWGARLPPLCRIAVSLL